MKDAIQQDIETLIQVFIGNSSWGYMAGNLVIPRVCRDLNEWGPTPNQKYKNDERMYWVSKCYMKYKGQSCKEDAVPIIKYWETQKKEYLKKYSHVYKLAEIKSIK